MHERTQNGVKGLQQWGMKVGELLSKKFFNVGYYTENAGRPGSYRQGGCSTAEIPNNAGIYLVRPWDGFI